MWSHGKPFVFVAGHIWCHWKIKKTCVIFATSQLPPIPFLNRMAVRLPIIWSSKSQNPDSWSKSAAITLSLALVSMRNIHLIDRRSLFQSIWRSSYFSPCVDTRRAQWGGGIQAGVVSHFMQLQCQSGLLLSPSCRRLLIATVAFWKSEDIIENAFWGSWSFLRAATGRRWECWQR